jgi:hypothetical protein
MISKPLTDLRKKTRRVPTVIVRESDEIAGSRPKAVVACPGCTLGGRNSQQRYAAGKLIHDPLESIIIILIHQNDLVIRKILLSQRFEESFQLVCA